MHVVMKCFIYVIVRVVGIPFKAGFKKSALMK